MALLTVELARTLPTEELYEIVWEMYKSVYGVRPRHMDPEDREGFLSFIEYELRPEVMEQRQAEWAAEAAALAEEEAELEAYYKEQDRQRQVELELQMAYDDRYDHLVK